MCLGNVAQKSRFSLCQLDDVARAVRGGYELRVMGDDSGLAGPTVGNKERQ